MNQSYAAAPVSPLARRVVGSTLVVLTATALVLMSVGGFASAAVEGSAPGVSSPGFQVLGLPLGTVVWVLLGVGGLIAGVIGVRRSRRSAIVAEAQASLVLDQVALAA